MPRKNSRVPRRKTRREFQSRTPHPARLAPIPIEQTVVPKGKCFVRSRHGKLKFTKAEVDTALRHAQHNRKMKGSGKVEERYYCCEDGRPEGCGFYHLTSLSTWEAKRAV